MQLLVDAGAQDDGRTELQRSVAAGNVDKVNQLIAAKVDVNQTGPSRITAVHIASEQGHQEILAALIKAGAKADEHDAHGMRPMHLAANAEVARTLMAIAATCLLLVGILYAAASVGVFAVTMSIDNFAIFNRAYSISAAFVAPTLFMIASIILAVSHKSLDWSGVAGFCIWVGTVGYAHLWVIAQCALSV